MRTVKWLVAATVALAGSMPLQAQSSAPTLQVCLRAYGEAARQARYRVTVDWKDFKAAGLHRIDLAAEDAGHDVWPQFRDERLRPRPRPIDELFTVSDVSQYPLQFYLIGFTRAAADAFDNACRDGFCSVRLPAEGVTELGRGVSIASVREAPSCD
jgi:hypothetical protein